MIALEADLETSKCFGLNFPAFRGSCLKRLDQEGGLGGFEEGSGLEGGIGLGFGGWEAIGGMGAAAAVGVGRIGGGFKWLGRGGGSGGGFGWRLGRGGNSKF